MHENDFKEIQNYLKILTNQNKREMKDLVEDVNNKLNKLFKKQDLFENQIKQQVENKLEEYSKIIEEQSSSFAKFYTEYEKTTDNFKSIKNDLKTEIINTILKDETFKKDLSNEILKEIGI